MHEWEPVTPVQLLFNEWVGEESKTIDLQEWITENMERVQELQDKTMGNYVGATEKRKVGLDKRAQERSFEKGDQVLYRMPGDGLKLQESWKGPYLVVKPLGPGTYKIDMGTRKTKVAHVRMLKKLIDRRVKRAFD